MITTPGTPGTKGTRVNLVSNNYKVTFTNPKLRIYQYDLQITQGDQDRIPSKAVHWKVYNDLKKSTLSANHWVYDGRRNLYAPRDITLEEEGDTTLGRDTFHYKLSGPVNSRNAQELVTAMTQHAVLPMDYISMMTLVIGQAFNNSGFETIARDYYDPSKDPTFRFRNGLELWSGVSASVTPTDGFGVTIRVLKSHQVMYPGGPLMDLAAKVLGVRNLPRNIDGRQSRTMGTLLKNLKVVTSHLGYERVYTVRGVFKESANQHMIDTEDGEISVKQYFLARYNINLRYPDLPLVTCGGQTKLPMELCTIKPNQPYFTNVDSATQADMIRQTCVRPADKKREIDATARTLVEKTNAFTGRDYGFTVDSRAVALTGRVLPSLTFGREHVSNGAWRMSKVLKGKSGDGKFSVFVVDIPNNPRAVDTLRTFTQKIITEAKRMEIGILELVSCGFIKSGDLQRSLTASTTPFNYMIMPDDSLYGTIKLCEGGGKITQCVKMNTVNKVVGGQRPPDMNTLNNILKKTNAKMNGTNWKVDVTGLPQKIMDRPTIILGADVTHFTGSNKPSIASVVGSCSKNLDAARYITRVRAIYPEEGRRSVEYIQGLQEMVREILMEFKRMLRCEPKRIIYYRDGVAEGQFEGIVMQELEQIQNAYS
uniref:Argonaute 4 n=1 Tax=Pleurobrachia bachei TaxID=34499 RepID=U3KTQ7_PLEBA|nr:argonaute 4 [Pleurobrachia bachei]|eukprot:sb/3462855/